MKNISIILTIALILSTVFYALDIISKDNECTSVRKYNCAKKEAPPPMPN